MEYDDEAMPNISQFEEMAKAYNLSLKSKGFVFINLEEEGRNILLDEIFDILFKLRSSYRGMGTFMSSNTMLKLTEKHLEKLREFFDMEKNRGYFVITNKTKCFLNSIALENALSLKLLLLSQKSQYGEEILSMIFEREKYISQNLSIENALSKTRY